MLINEKSKYNSHINQAFDKKLNEIYDYHNKFKFYPSHNSSIHPLFSMDY